MANEEALFEETSVDELNEFELFQKKAQGLVNILMVIRAKIGEITDERGDLKINLKRQELVKVRAMVRRFKDESHELYIDAELKGFFGIGVDMRDAHDDPVFEEFDKSLYRARHDERYDLFDATEGRSVDPKDYSIICTKYNAEYDETVEDFQK